MPPPVPLSIVTYVTGREEVILRFCSGRRAACVASGIDINISWKGYSKRGLLEGKSGLGNGLSGLFALYMHTKYEIFSFSRSGNTRVITDKITESPTEPQTSGAIGLHIASFGHIGVRVHKTT